MKKITARMINRLINRRLCAKEDASSDYNRYAAVLFFLLSDIKDAEHMKEIYRFAEMIWFKEIREEQKAKEISPVFGKN